MTVGWDISREKVIAKHNSVDVYKVKQWCAVYKCCQVRVNCDMGETEPGEGGPAPYGEESMLEDGRTHYLRMRMHTDQMMGYFSKDLRYHREQRAESLDGEGYTRLPEGFHRVKLLQYRRWLARRDGKGVRQQLYDSDEDSLFSVEDEDSD